MVTALFFRVGVFLAALLAAMVGAALLTVVVAVFATCSLTPCIP